jgi:hypothetical protein
LDVTNLKQHQKSKPIYLQELRDAQTPVFGTHLVASYNYAGINGGCNSIDCTHKGIERLKKMTNWQLYDPFNKKLRA